MKKVFLLLVTVSSFVTVLGQSDKPEATGGASKAVYGELGGSGLAFSANFDSRFKGFNGFGFRIGIGGAGGTGGGILTFPVGFNYLAGKKGPHFFEVGATVTLVTAAFDISDETGSSWFALPHFGYRYTKPASSFNGRIYVGPIITDGFVFFPFGGISAGFTF